MTAIEENWIFAENDLDEINPVTFQLITKMNQISHDPVVVILIEKNAANLEKVLSAYGPDKIITIKDDALATGDDLEITDALANLIEKKGTPNTLIFPATVAGRSIAPRLQARLQTGLTADCLDLHFEGNLLIQTKPSYGDNIMCEITIPECRPQMVTARPNVFSSEKKINPNLEIETVSNIQWKKDDQLQIKSRVLLAQKAKDIKQAKHVVAIGRGSKTAKDIEGAVSLAKKLNASLGVTRPLTDLDTFTIADQIGQSGQTIAPDLLINLGISGAVQYTSGISNAKIVVSINTDKNAQIFKHSDYFFVGNAQEFAKSLEAIL
ncbi:electron transfer flavoprotein subunit alpha/FixB family protein [Companilactobacillus futsaii]|uniref:Electron transfer flavoprotein subunit alpha/FixB family protein n=2 Tax=Companilactobacillus futsaii TaxID=938155 RepID=A0A5B7T584_9LACO|nr:electron transfer flavoprotein subunit alpha/FixB family protein [Companilactobacillus futsaii]KRK98385.1 electron transfer flavoprotein, alpha subunit [Companilactobacillus futsaii JCM 17355]QCX25522.1 electron transfer flavoprotein subunit alpha/FixB family protein [Companilactobacillus futsaii]